MWQGAESAALYRSISTARTSADRSGKISRSWEFYEFRPIYRLVLLSHAAFEMRAVVHVVLGRRLGCRQAAPANWCRPRSSSSVDMKILFHIGPEVERAAGQKRALDVAKKRFSHHSAFFMPLFPPRIGKINVHRLERIVGKQFREDSQGIALDHDCIAQVPLEQHGRGKLGVFRGDFDAQKIDIRLKCGGSCAKKAPCPIQLRPPTALAGRTTAKRPTAWAIGRTFSNGSIRSSEGSIFRKARRPIC